MIDRELLARLVDEQAPALFVVSNAGYAGHALALHGEQLVVYVRPVLCDAERAMAVWDVAEIQDVGPAQAPPAAEHEDPMMQTARELVARAREYSQLSLAERLLRAKATQGGTHNDQRGEGG